MARTAVTIPSIVARDWIALPTTDGNVPGGPLRVPGGRRQRVLVGAGRARMSDSNGGEMWDSSIG